MEKDLVKLAERYCTHYHEGQKRKGGNQPPYEIHPFTVRDILVKYGYDDEETQVIALLHDTIEDTELGNNKGDIEKIFGTVIYEGVYILSTNTPGKHAQELAPLFKSFGIELTSRNGFLTPEAYKLRLLFSRDTVKRVKIADVIHNTTSLPDLSKTGIERKIYDAEIFIFLLEKWLLQ